MSLARAIVDHVLHLARDILLLRRCLRDASRLLLAALPVAVLSGGAAQAQEWPNRTIRAIVPLTAGSATDIVARTVLEQVSGQVGQAIIVENRPGAGNTTGMAAAARATPDGYTVLVNSSSHTIVPATYTDLPFDTLSDLAPVIPLGNIPTVLVVPASKGYRTLADLIAAAKAKPGAMNYSSAGAGNFSHFAAEVFRRAADFEAVHVPSKGAPEALTEVLTARVDFFFSPLILALPFVKEGKLKALAVSGSQRALALPDVPTTVEAGYPDSTYNFWVGMFAPAKVPSAIVATLYQQTARAVQNASVQEKLVKLGVDPMVLTSAQFAALVREEVAVNTRIAAAVGVKAD